MTQDTSHRAQTQLPATYLIPGGAGQHGWGPLHFYGFSIIRNIKVTLPNHHLPRPTRAQNQGRNSLPVPHGEDRPRLPPKRRANGGTGPHLPGEQAFWAGPERTWMCHRQAVHWLVPLPGCPRPQTRTAGPSGSSVCSSAAFSDRPLLTSADSYHSPLFISFVASESLIT